MRSMQYPLPIIPNDPGSTLSTVLWWDNFDCNKETKEGSIHTCHGVAFQEEFEQTSCRDEAVEVVRPKKRTVSVLPHVLPRQNLRLTRNLSFFSGNVVFTYDSTLANRLLLSSANYMVLQISKLFRDLSSG